MTQVQASSTGSWAVIQSVGYDAWGNSRNVATGAANNTAYQSPIADSQALGYTGHINLAALGLVHMGGRVYDPAIGRFLSADPNVQAPLDSQSYDRYSYTLNNPLSLTDPSGYFSFGTVLEIAAVAAASYLTFGAADSALYADFASSGMSATAAAGAAAADAGVLAGMAGGAVSGFLNTPGGLDDRLGGALGYGVMGGVFAATGSYFGVAGSTAGTSAYFEKAAVEGLEGGLLSEAGGGRFGGGFLGAAVGSLDEPLLARIGTDNAYARIEQATVAATIGGTLAEISGGNFSNGAVTAAFQNLFNAQESRTRRAVSAIVDSEGEVVITYSDGSVEARAWGTISWRDNNPGNIISSGSFAKGHGAIGANRKFAVFPNFNTGYAAAIANLKTPTYQVLDIGSAINDWAPASDGNDPVAYAADIARMTTFSISTPISSLTDAQLSLVVGAIQVREGWRIGSIGYVAPGQQY